MSGAKEEEGTGAAPYGQCHRAGYRPHRDRGPSNQDKVEVERAMDVIDIIAFFLYKGKMGYYIHYVPGRIRIQTPFLHNNPRNVAEFETYIKGVKGIISIKYSIVAGSATILFNEKIINCEQIIGILERRGYFSLSKAETSDQVIKKATEKILEKL